MANAIVALFDELNEAQDARSDLLSAGFSDRDVQLSGNDMSFVVTAVAATEEKSDLATQLLSNHHPIDLDERSTEWLAGQESTGPWSAVSSVLPEIQEAILRNEAELAASTRIEDDEYENELEAD